MSVSARAGPSAPLKSASLGMTELGLGEGKRLPGLVLGWCGGLIGWWLCGLGQALEAGATEDWPSLGGFEGDGGFRATLGTVGSGLRADALRAAASFGLALFAVPGVVFELFVVKKDLLACRKDKLRAAVIAFQDSIGEFHGRLPKTGRYTERGP